MALLSKTRGFSALGLLIASYAFGAILWVWSLLLTLQLWGALAVIIGLLIMGIGIVPVAILAVIFHAEMGKLGRYRHHAYHHVWRQILGPLARKQS